MPGHDKRDPFFTGILKWDKFGRFKLLQCAVHGRITEMGVVVSASDPGKVLITREHVMSKKLLRKNIYQLLYLLRICSE